MIEDELEVKIQKVVKDPKLSLKRFSQYIVATNYGKKRILLTSKYPGDYVPKFYEIARRFICDVFSSNIDDYDIYFDEFKKQASTLRKQALDYPSNKDAHKNRICSANGLDQLVAMSVHLIPILNKFVLNSNLSHKKDAITRNGLKIGSMADMLLHINAGATQVGFLKFNFTTKTLSKEEASGILLVLKTFFEKKGVDLDLKACFLVDVFDLRVYRASDQPDVRDLANNACKEIVEAWDSI